EHKTAFRLDAAALGKDLARVTAATVECRLPDGKMTLHSLVRIALKQAGGEGGSELDYAIRPDGVVITLPRLAAHDAVYHLPQILGPTAQFGSELWILQGEQRDSKPETPEALLARVLTTTVPLRPWESVELINGTRLVVHASPDRHSDFVDLLDQIHRLASIS